MHGVDPIVFAIFLIFTGAALMSTVALFTRQSLLVAYIVLGVLFGPWGFKLVVNSSFIKPVGDVGITFLLFLLGLNLRPQSLLHMLRKTILVTLSSSLLFASIGFFVGIVFGFGYCESFVIGLAMMFSSTIIGLKLLPTNVLHHRRVGEVMISVLLLQDLIAIVVLLFIHITSTGKISWVHISTMLIALPLMFMIAYLMERFVLMRLIKRFDKVHEYVFLLSIAWCLSMAQLAMALGLSEGIGAFIAGITIAANPISEYIANNLRPLRDFFLVMFFFYIGAEFNLDYLHIIIVPAVILAILMLLVKPLVFRYVLRQTSETQKLSWETGVRLGQVSEFSLLVAYLAMSTNVISASASYLIQATTIITFMVSSYIVVLRYPTPMAVTDELRQD